MAHRLVENHAKLRASGKLNFVRPDAKSQVTIEYKPDGTPNRIHTVVLSTQHDESVVEMKKKKKVFSDKAREEILNTLIIPTLKAERPDLVDAKTKFHFVPVGESGKKYPTDVILCHINPTGIFSKAALTVIAALLVEKSL